MGIPLSLTGRSLITEKDLNISILRKAFMGRQIELDPKMFLGLKESLMRFSDRLMAYFMHLVPFQKYSWAAVALGFILLVVAIILW